MGISAPGGLESVSPTSFPADFISEALDQTRGWFYSLLAISTLLFSEESEGGEPRAGQLASPHPTSARGSTPRGWFPIPIPSATASCSG